MNNIAAMIEAANADINVGDIYKGHAGKIRVVEISPLGDKIWFEDGLMHVVTPYASRVDFCKLVRGMIKLGQLNR